MRVTQGRFPAPNQTLVLAAIAITTVVAFSIAWLLVSGNSQRPDTDRRNGRSFIQSNLWSAGDTQYAVYIGRDDRPMLGTRSLLSDEWTTVDLSTLPGNPLATPTVDDGHNVYVVASDETGALHIAGNMHGDPLRYIRTTSQNGAFDVGKIGHTGERVTYPRFVSLLDGSLLFFRRDGQSGFGSTELSVLAPGAQTWRTIGTILDGEPTDESPYLHHVAVDPKSGAIHILFVWRDTPDVGSNNDVGYAVSIDGGESWATIDGDPLGSTITHSDTSTVIDTAPTGSGLLNGGGLTVDDDGRPHATVAFVDNRSGRQRVRHEHLWHDGVSWQRDTLDVDFDGRTSIAALPSGDLWVLGGSGGTIEAARIQGAATLESRRLASVTPGWEPIYDDQALRDRGVVEILVNDGDVPVLVTLGP